MKKFYKNIIALILFLTGTITAFSQNTIWTHLGASSGIPDSNYIYNYERDLIGRVYYSRKNTGFNCAAPDKATSFSYKPNNSKGIGIGLSYRFLTLNLQFGLLGRDESKGKTSSFDFQTNLYKKQWVYDFVIQTYKGMYLTPKGYNTTDNSYFIRPDIRMTLVGGDFWRIMNSDRFSYRAVMTQNDWQIKSAGSLLLGSEIYYGITSGDKPLIPDSAMKNYTPFQQGINKVKLFRVGPGIGYAYTLVLSKNFFLSGGITANYDFAYSKELSDTAQHGKIAMSPNLTYRIGIGYNNRRWNINASLVDNSVIARSATVAENYKIFNQSFRITVAYRYTPTHKLRKRVLSPVDENLDKVEQTIKGKPGK